MNMGGPHSGLGLYVWAVTRVIVLTDEYLMGDGVGEQ